MHEMPVIGFLTELAGTDKLGTRVALDKILGAPLVTREEKKMRLTYVAAWLIAGKGKLTDSELSKLLS